MGNPARHNSNLNNPYIPKIQDLIRGEQNDGMYSATFESDWYWDDTVNISERQVKQAIAGAEAVCNQSEFEGVRFTHHKEDSEHGDGYDITIEFEW